MIADAGGPLLLVVGGMIVAAAVFGTLAVVFFGVWIARRMRR